MNSLSWFIYAIGVLDTMRGAAFAFVCIGGGVALIGLVSAPILLDVLGELDEDLRPFMKTSAKRFLVAFGIAGLVLVIAPSRQTMLLIAGSEIGERFVQSKAVTDIVDPSVDLLKSWIREETKKLNKEKS